MKKPRVAIVINDLEMGGAQRQVIELLKGAARRGFDLHVIVLSDRIPLIENATSSRNVHLLPKKYRKDIFIVLRLARLLHRLKVDIVHGFLTDAVIISRLAGRIANVKRIIGSERNSDYAIDGVRKLVLTATRRWQVCCIANSRAGAEFNRRSFGGDPADYVIMYNGVDTGRFRPRDITQTRESLGMKRELIWVGMFGSFKRQKNHLLLLEIAARISRLRSDLRFLVVGDVIDGDGGASVKVKREVVSNAIAAGLTETVQFVGAKSDVERYYSACDLTILPSLHEGTPNVALESMACGVPVIASDVADNSLIIREGVTGYLVGEHNADDFVQIIMTALGPTSTLSGEKCREWIVENFDRDRLVDEQFKFYNDILTQG